MNRIHRWLCGSERWKTRLESEILPWTLAGVDPGNNVLEIGPGPGLTTELLSGMFLHVTGLELDARLARRARQRLAGKDVSIVRGDGTALPFATGSFSGAMCFTMLHHVPSTALQDKLLEEAARVLRPGGVFAGVDSLGSLTMQILHLGDTLVPIDPATLAGRLELAGFTNPQITVNGRRFRFTARKP